MKRIQYNRNKCIGCGICATDAPDIWTINNTDGKANLMDGENKNSIYYRPLWDDEKIAVEKIVVQCTVKAIKII